MNKYYLIYIFSFIYSRIVAKNIKSIYINNKHIHHWIWGSILLILFYKNKLMVSILLGIVMEGLSYNDRFVL